MPLKTTAQWTEQRRPELFAHPADVARAQKQPLHAHPASSRRRTDKETNGPAPGSSRRVNVQKH